MNPGLARAIGTMLKQDFQRAVLNRVHRMDTDATRSQRPVLFVCDEYQAFATTGENEPSGDEKFFSLARQARCIPVLATQSISSLRSTLPGESWRTLLQGLRTKIFLTLSDDFSAQMAADLCGKVERLKPGYTITEAGQDAGVSMLTGRPAAHKTTVSAAKTYSLEYEYVFQPKIFAELRTARRSCCRTTDSTNSRRRTATSSRRISTSRPAISIMPRRGPCNCYNPFHLPPALLDAPLVDQAVNVLFPDSIAC
jgi:TraM recognition site of TraD and TraG